MKTVNKIYLYSVIIFMLIAGLCAFFVKNIDSKNNNKVSEGKYLIIGRKNAIAVFEDRLAVKIPYEIELVDDETLDDMVKNKEYNRIMDNINKILPINVESYKIVKLGRVNLNVKNSLNIPETREDNRRYIIQESVNSLFSEYYKIEQDISFDKVQVEILNGKGINGYAKKVGNALAEKLGITYIASTHTEIIGETEIIVNDLSKKRVEELIMQLGEKYIKIRQTPSSPDDANIVLILGNDRKSQVKIELIGEKSNIKDVEKQLVKLNYKNIVKREIETVAGIKEDKPDGTDEHVKIKGAIEYNKEYYYTAYKLRSTLGISDMVENNALNKTIKIILKR